VGSGVVLLAEMLVYYRATGDWLFHVHETERNYHQYPNAFFVAGSRLADPDGGGYSRALVRRLLLGGPMTIFRNAQFLYLPLLAGIVSLHAAYRRDRRFLLPALWFVSLVLMFNFFSSSFSSYVPLVLFDRYLYPILLPGIVLVAGFLTDLFRERRTADQTGAHDGRFWGTLVLAGLLLAALDKNYANRKYAPGWASASRHVAVLLKPSDRIYTDVLSIHGLEFFWSYPPQLNTVDVAQANPASAIRTGDYVLVNSAYLDWLVRMAGWWPSTSPVYRPPESFRTVPSSWNKVWNNETAVLYRVE
jgi:hypothetical protein